MKFYPTNIVKEIRDLRKTGLSLRKLEQKYNIPNSTISSWVRDIDSSNKIFLTSRKKISKYKNCLARSVNKIKFNKLNAQILVAMLYWCEGSKYPSTNNLSFSNSDFNLVMTYLELLRIGFNINEEKLRVRLQIHSTHDYNIELKYWSDLLQIPVVRFNKPTVTNPTNNMKRRNYHGTCTIKYYDVKLQLNIIGLYEAIGLKIKRRGG